MSPLTQLSGSPAMQSPLANSSTIKESAKMPDSPRTLRQKVVSNTSMDESTLSLMGKLIDPEITRLIQDNINSAKGQPTKLSELCLFYLLLNTVAPNVSDIHVFDSTGILTKIHPKEILTELATGISTKYKATLEYDERSRKLTEEPLLRAIRKVREISTGDINPYLLKLINLLHGTTVDRKVSQVKLDTASII